MSLRKLPALNMRGVPPGASYQPPARALEQWQPDLVAADAGDGPDGVIQILDYIGDDGVYGVSASKIAEQLKAIGENDVTVDINSPGGSVFEGVAIYNLLRAHKGKVTVRIIGMAASIASVIAMAGDDIQIGKAAFFMIHNSWVLAIGDRNGLRAAADYLEPFDAAIAGVYVDRAGVDKDQVVSWMDAETYFNGERAVEEGFADALLPTDLAIKDEVNGAARVQSRALHRVEAALAKEGMPRSERRALLSELKGGTPGAASTVTPRADQLAAALARLEQTISA